MSCSCECRRKSSAWTSTLRICKTACASSVSTCESITMRVAGAARSKESSMWTFDCRNVNDAYARLSHYIMSRGIRLDSRNGATMTAPGPVLVRFRQPYERVLFDEARDANPTFHLMEAVWMLAGARDVAFVEHYNKNMRTFSDDGVVFNAAYGHRWRHYFGQDQLLTVVGLLRANPNDRRAIISMWDAHADLDSDSKDVPCNLQILPRLVDEPDIGKALEFTITNRSNDLVW